VGYEPDELSKIHTVHVYSPCVGAIIPEETYPWKLLEATTGRSSMFPILAHILRHRRRSFGGQSPVTQTPRHTCARGRFGFGRCSHGSALDGHHIHSPALFAKRSTLSP